MKTARLTVKYSQIRGAEASSLIDAGPWPVEVTFDRDSSRLRVKGPKIEATLDDVEAFDLVQVVEEPPKQ